MSSFHILGPIGDQVSNGAANDRARPSCKVLTTSLTPPVSSHVGPGQALSKLIYYQKRASRQEHLLGKQGYLYNLPLLHS